MSKTQDLNEQKNEAVFEVIKASGNWQWPKGELLFAAQQGAKNVYIRMTDSGTSNMLRLATFKDERVNDVGKVTMGFQGMIVIDTAILVMTFTTPTAYTDAWTFSEGGAITGVDSAFSDTSTNPVQNKVVTAAIQRIGQPLQWKGPATVSELNTGITGIQPGWTYTLTDAGTLTDGSIAVEAGDEVAWTEDDEWFKVGGDSSNVVVVPYDVVTHADLSTLIAARQAGKAVILANYRASGVMEYYYGTTMSYEEGYGLEFVFVNPENGKFIKVVASDGSEGTWTEGDTNQIAVFKGVAAQGGVSYPNEAEVRAAVDAGKYVIIRIGGMGGYNYYGIGYQYANQYTFPNLLTHGHELRLQLNQQGTAYEWSTYSEPVIPGTRVFTGTYNPAASPADYSGMPNTLDIAAALDAGYDVVLMLTNPADSNVYAYRLVSNAQYTKRFMAIDNNSSVGGWKNMPVVLMTYAGPGNPWGWAKTGYLSQELRLGTITESDIINDHCNVNNLNALTTMTLTSVNSVTMHTMDYNATNNFAVQIDNTGNSNDVTIDVQHGPDSLKYSVAGGNTVGAGKYMQLTCVGSCWTLAEFTLPTP